MLVLSGCQEPDSRSEAFRQSYHQGLDLLERYRLRAAERALCALRPAGTRRGRGATGSWACSPRLCRPVRRPSGSNPSGRCGASTSPSTYERLDPNQARAEWARVRIFGRRRRERGAADWPHALSRFANLATGEMMIDLVAFDLDGTVLDAEGGWRLRLWRPSRN